ncbi:MULTISPECIES: D-2-hydroxyacid dehydrogenase [Pelosinus]|uniref:D-isomer specific 2-hydroxyacid dehydrogenase NAD-binding protein n=1 Tax=Pelosinus fermentans B4 TaxID=1149862 RepID=I9LH62_9FIRM|nr:MULTISPECIES: D-2-hydroxyacid dehydrogenase [Pelosinus]EIW19819.1 D-isomer specific 2-hydroxyacid dehydrogenase NAD-binding protein [Pelosinus fermentans B4]EIW21324.1 D-isomer specific 2-hydroxyacid dehydrogenase NAD-binding protein [Pelosinus fermentans A11]OAM94973.1 Glyoxylate reductase [Pelosinus fermentans DSM 17108]SDR21359.1 Phosphoglycerate dehydrogenase [Pelosinus fermentans]
MPNLNILVINNLADRHMKIIQSSAPNSNIITCDYEKAAEHIRDIDILVPWGSMDVRPLYLAAPKLTWIHSLSAGVEGLIFPEIQNANTIITNSRGIHGIPVSEHVFAMMLVFTRGLDVFIRQQAKHQWKRTIVEEIHDKTIGIVGLGSIGREIAKKAKGLGMKVVASKQTMTKELFVDELYPPEKLHELLSLSDFVVTALPLLNETKHLFTINEFSVMKPSAYFINIARGGIIKQDDLITALEQGLIKGACLDVFDEEPLSDSSPLWDMQNVIITPHVAALSPSYLDRAVKLFADNLSRFQQNKEMLNIIDKIKGY